MKEVKKFSGLGQDAGAEGGGVNSGGLGKALSTSQSGALKIAKDGPTAVDGVSIERSA